MTKKCLVVGVDNDEFLGDFGNASLYHQYLKYFKYPEEKRIELVSEYLTKNFCVRPHVDKLFSTFQKLKTDYPDRVKIAMVTSCRNNEGWVSMLKNCLEKIYDCEGMYDAVISGEHLSYNFFLRVANKNKEIILSHPSLNCPSWNFVMLDDKPEAVIADHVITVPQFHVMSPLMKYVIRIPGVKEMFDSLPKTESKKLKNAINNGFVASELIDSQTKASNDEEMLGVIEKLNTYVEHTLSSE